MRAWGTLARALWNLHHEGLTPEITLLADAWAALGANELGEVEGHLGQVLARTDQVLGRPTFLRALSPPGRDET